VLAQLALLLQLLPRRVVSRSSPQFEQPRD